MYLDPDGPIRAGIVLDNLVHDGVIPPTVGVFIDPGEPANRNIEYDPADGRYADFLLTEILPEARRRATLVDDPERRGVVGGSSGGNCAFTVAWHRPDRFTKVVSLVGSFAQIPGGDPYPDLLARSSPKPLRVFLQEGRFDLNHDRREQNWVAHNLRLAAALAEAGYDYRLELGDGGHDAEHGGAILPDALRWLWRP